jgi:hypothetical protein
MHIFLPLFGLFAPLLAKALAFSPKTYYNKSITPITGLPIFAAPFAEKEKVYENHFGWRWLGWRCDLCAAGL